MQVCVALGMVFAYLNNREQPGFGDWTLFFVSITLGLAAYAMRALLPFELSVIAGNSLTLISAYFFTRGLKKFFRTEGPSMALFGVMPVAFGILTTIVFTYASEQVFYRIACYSLASAWATFPIALFPLRQKTNPKSNGLKLVAAAFLTIALFSSSRFFLVLYEPTQLAARHGWLAQIFLLLVTLLTIFTMMGCLLMANERSGAQMLEVRQKLNEQELKTTRDMLERAVVYGGVGIWSWDISRRKISWNDRMRQLFDREASDEIISMEEFESCIHRDDLSGVRAIVLDSLKNGKHFDFEVRVIAPSGQLRWVNIIGKTIPGENRRAKEVVGVALDVTRQRETEAEKLSLEENLHQAQKVEALGRLAGGVAHDINNMLGVIIGHAELAMAQTDISSSVQDDLSEIHVAAMRSADITRQLLAFARKQEITPRVVNLNTLVENILKMLRRLIGEDIEIKWVADASLKEVKIDPTQFDQIMANLATNARDAIAGVGTITIKTSNTVMDEAFCRANPGSTPGEYATLTFTDSGKGISPDLLGKIFEPFYTTKESGKGTGLGLATIYGIVKQNNGYLEVISRPAEGATFRISLPVTHEQAAEERQELPARKAEFEGRGRILVVEDEPGVLKFTEKVLTKLGYEVLTASSTEEALYLARIDGQRLDLLVTDVVMPVMNGVELAGEIKKLHQGMECLYMSGYTSDLLAKRGVVEQSINFIPKPFTVVDLAKKVKTVLER